MEVDVQPGETVNVYYGGPNTQWVSKGNIGLTPQSRPDTLSFIVIIAGILMSAAVVGIIVTR